MNSQVKLVSCMSLEDKAKDKLGFRMYQCINCNKRDFLTEEELLDHCKECPRPIHPLYKQAIKDLMERATNKTVEVICSSGLRENRAVRFNDLEQAAEDLIKEGE